MAEHAPSSDQPNNSAAGIKSKIYISDFIGYRPVCIKKVLNWAEKLTGFPYGLCDTDTIELKEQEIQKLTQLLNDVPKGLQPRINNLTVQLTKLSDESKKLKNQINTKNDAITACENEIKKLEKLEENAKLDLNEWQNVNELTFQLNQLRIERENLKGPDNINELNQKINACENEIKELEKLKEKAEQHLEEWHRCKNNLTVQLTKLSDESKKLNNQINTKNDAITACENEIKELEKLKEAKLDKPQWQKRKDELKSDLIRLNADANADAFEKIRKKIEKLKITNKEEIDAIKKAGIVCNTYVEIVMRESGFSNFPISHFEYLPQTEKYKAISESRLRIENESRDRLRKKRLSRLPSPSPWQLHWAERMVDWIIYNKGTVAYDFELGGDYPKTPENGDIVIFGKWPEETKEVLEGLRFFPKHVNLVFKEENNKFNFAGARNSSKHSCMNILENGFITYEQKYHEKSLSQIVHGDYLIMWILRPNYKPCESDASESESTN